jgi:hypothetical protein
LDEIAGDYQPLTELLCRRDAYLKRCSASVTRLGQLTVWHLLSWCDGMDWPWLRRTAEEFDIFAAVRHTSSRCGNGRSGRRKI